MKLNNPTAPATRKQLWLLHILTKEDTRDWQLTIEQASNKIGELKGNGKRPLVNPHATALTQDKQLRAQQRYDRGNGHKHAGDAKNYLPILKEANQAAIKAYQDYCDNNYKTPRYAVVQHKNPLDDSSPVERAWPLTDLCGFVWLELKLKGNEKFINWFKKQGKIDNSYNSKRWRIEGFGLAYSSHCSVWSYPWTLDLPGIGNGNGAISAAEASTRAAVAILDNHGIDVHMRSRLD